MAADLSALAAPVYIGSMVAEHRALQKRAAKVGPTAADYLKPDARASLLMGVGSGLYPAMIFLSRSVVPRRGRLARAALGAAVAAVVVTTIADRVERSSSDEARRQQARDVARVGGVAAVAFGGLIVTASSAQLGSAQRHWSKRKGRDLGTGVLAWTTAMVGWDFIYYWNHRFMHEVRALWAVHEVHHSSEHYNLGTALRQPVASAFGLYVPYGAMARFGVRPSLIEYSRGLNLIYQFFVHTDVVKRLNPLAEQVLNTPSHHRVHHGSNRRYLDRNHGGILIVWDRLFGTFEAESDDEPVVYGLTKNLGTFNPLTVATHEHRDMFRDVAESNNWRDRLSFVLRGPGWAFRRRNERASARIVTRNGVI
jgi:sterol desaturase/sphingolipid hydroxylase (fatty acid hydroxylase superfamily)